MFPAMKTIRTALVLILGGMICTPRVCEGFISYTWVGRGMYTAGEPIGYSLDFNGDLILDLIFQSNGMWFDVDPAGDNRVIGSGGDVRALLDGFLIGPGVDPDLWADEPFGSAFNSSAVVPPGVVINTGEFRMITAYMGVMFYIEDSVHYGWVRISNPFDGTGGIIMDFAYETEPGGDLLGSGLDI